MSLIPICGLLNATITRRELTLPSVYWSSCCSICVVFCRSLFVLLSFCFSPLYCQFFYLQFLIAPSECSFRRSSTYQCYSPWRDLTVLEIAMLAITPPVGIEKWNFHSVRVHCITALTFLFEILRNHWLSSLYLVIFHEISLLTVLCNSFWRDKPMTP